MQFFKNNKNWTDVKVSIVVSTGRTGTKYFYSVIDKLPDYIATHEPKPIGNIEGASFLKNELSQKELVKFLLNGRKTIRNDLKKSKTKNYFESNGGLIFFLNVLNDVFPNLRVAHIIRDPRDFVRSACSRLEKNGSLKYKDDSNWLFKSTYYPNDKFYSQWNEMEMPERFMWAWNLKNKFASLAVEKYNNFQTFRFEDIMFNDSKKIDFFDFILMGQNLESIKNIIGSESKVQKNETTSFLYPEYNDWGKEVKLQLETHCGELMKKFNYL